MKKAGDLGVRIISEEEFRNMLPQAAGGTAAKEQNVEPDLFSGMF